MIDREVGNIGTLQAYAQASKRQLVKRVRAAMVTISAEIEAAEGIYPFGKLTQKEVCVRAGITQSALQKPTHRNSTLLEVNEWLKQIAEAMRTSKSVRKVVNNKLVMLQERNADLKQQAHECELALIDANAKIAELKLQIASLTTPRQSQVTSIEAVRVRRDSKH